MKRRDINGLRDADLGSGVSVSAMSLAKPCILVIDNDSECREVIGWMFRDEFDVVSVSDVDQGLSLIRRGSHPVVLLGLRDGPKASFKQKTMKFLSGVQELGRSEKIIAYTLSEELSYATELVQRGVYDLFLRPLDFARLRSVLWRASWAAPFISKSAGASSGASAAIGEIVGISPEIHRLSALISKVAAVDVRVLITGESGTGKELTAKAIHDRSLQKHGSFVVINCGAIPENLLESELFGYERGAFTGATRQKKGKIEYAHGGTLFLDEVAELPLSLQPKILRFLEDRKITRIGGGHEEIQVDTQIIAVC